MATIKFVGPAPIVSDRGVRFDPSKPDKYIYLSAALQLAEAFDVRGEAHDIVYHPKSSEFSETVINDMLQKYCPDLDKRVEERKEKARALAQDLKNRIESHPHISEEARRAWLGNIENMIGYYMQYVTNEEAYECLLERIADEVVKAKIKEIKLPLLNHFGMVLHHLAERLEQRKPPVDSEFHVEHTQAGLLAIVKLRHA
ncbi:hypothetical protein [Hydrogenimonas sp. SS33]|uniref:hypothetical protein n=1 Tax=Hydrogenimonas leucolamina TaxID=2954236 RepID=UPI00336C09BF